MSMRKLPSATVAPPTLKAAPGTARKTAPKTGVKPDAVPAPKADRSKAVATPGQRAAAATPGDSPKGKHKLVRDSFAFPKAEYALLEAMKERAGRMARPVKKSELLRAGVAVLNALNDKAFLAAVNRVPSLKTGRPKQDVVGTTSVSG